eukprot:CAMPEP_0119132428 /NCGR_PEP_ID=MMETSP1310-20130426/11833_1 /TAXON_ID=464262 /ORGANISM="Genus nov. species nov., Strain RCC2339" /LENGTH=289 /DNA_ID=CAMNT_0007123061 /DNA_START=80 /DNA_END=946 /DNA_ORIENTATION=-
MADPVILDSDDEGGFEDALGRDSIILEWIEDPTLSGSEFYNNLVTLEGFPLHTEWHHDDVRLLKPKLIEVVNDRPSIPKSRYNSLPAADKRVFSALQRQATVQAEAFSAAVAELSSVSKMMFAFRRFGMFERGDDDDLPDKEEEYRAYWHMKLTDSATETLERSKRCTALAAIHYSQTVQAMRDIVMDAGGVDRDVRGDMLSEEQVRKLGIAQEERRADTLAKATNEALKAAAARNKNYRKNYRGGGGGGNGGNKDKKKKKKKKRGGRGRGDGSSTEGGCQRGSFRLSL